MMYFVMRVAMRVMLRFPDRFPPKVHGCPCPGMKIGESETGTHFCCGPWWDSGACTHAPTAQEGS